MKHITINTTDINKITKIAKETIAEVLKQPLEDDFIIHCQDTVMDDIIYNDGSMSEKHMKTIEYWLNLAIDYMNYYWENDDAIVNHMLLKEAGIRVTFNKCENEIWLENTYFELDPEQINTHDKVIINMFFSLLDEEINFDQLTDGIFSIKDFDNIVKKLKPILDKNKISWTEIYEKYT